MWEFHISPTAEWERTLLEVVSVVCVGVEESGLGVAADPRGLESCPEESLDPAGATLLELVTTRSVGLLLSNPAYGELLEPAML